MIELLNNLQQQAELHENLLSLLQNESGGFGRLRGSELLKLQGEKSRCIRAAAQLEKERIQLVKQYAKSWNTDSKELTLSVIIDRADEEYSVLGGVFTAVHKPTPERASYLFRSRKDTKKNRYFVPY